MYETTYPTLRFHHKLPLKWFHFMQRYYGPLALSLANFGEMFDQFDETNKFSNYPVRRGTLLISDFNNRFITMAFWFVYTLILPVSIFGFVKAWPLWMMYNIVMGTGYAYIIAVNHWTVEAGLSEWNDAEEGKNDWCELQVINSQNFANDSFFWTQLSGGLNY